MKPEIADVLQIVKKFRDLNNKEKFLICDEVPNGVLDEKSQEQYDKLMDNLSTE